VATQIPQASGIGFAIRYKGTDEVVLTCFGEGSTSEGDFHEGLNWAGIYKLPVIFLCENNLYAISEPIAKEMPGKNVADRAAAYGIPGVIVDGNDMLEVYRVMSEAVARARRGDGATLVEAKTYRPVPHSSDDDDRAYRSREEVEEWKSRCPIRTLREKILTNEGAPLPSVEQVEREVQQWIEAAVQFARESPEPEPSTVYDHIFS
jgi:2-oxoisovalerate dehydrogenase E1 component alpha subunit